MIKVSIDSYRLKEWHNKDDMKGRVEWLACQCEKFKDSYEKYKKEVESGDKYPSLNDFLGFYNDANILPHLPYWIVDGGHYTKYWEFFKPLHFVKPEDEDKSVSSMGILELVKLNQIRLPDNLLLQIREVEVINDACTNEINGMLKDGWRIIAVCVQHAQRRPDYVMGRI